MQDQHESSSRDDADINVNQSVYVPPRKGHVTGETFERFDVSICQHSSVDLIGRLYRYCAHHLRVRICRSKCSSLVKDCPQYVQKTILICYAMLCYAGT